MGLHKRCFFHYFKNKEELLLRILEKPIEEVSINLEKMMNNNELRPEEKLREAIDNHLTLLTEHIDITYILERVKKSIKEESSDLFEQEEEVWEGF